VKARLTPREARPARPRAPPVLEQDLRGADGPEFTQRAAE
jgi:hypothetical protein